MIEELSPNQIVTHCKIDYGCGTLIEFGCKQQMTHMNLVEEHKFWVNGLIP